MLKSAPKPRARITGASLHNLSLDRVDLIFDVEVSNPYTVSLPLTNLTYAIGSAGHKLVDGQVKSPGSVPARGSKVIQLPASIGFKTLLSALQGVKPGSIVGYTADATLSVDAPVIGPLTLPLSHRGELPVPAVPEVTVSAVNVGALSLDKVEATARVRIRNTNQFDLDLARLAFNLALGGEDVAKTTMSDAARLAPGQSSDVEIPLSFSPRSLGVGLFNLLRGSQAGYRITGNAQANTRFGTIGLPLDGKGSAPIAR